MTGPKQNKLASEQLASEVRAGVDIFREEVSREVDLAKFVLGGVAALMFFVADFSSRLMGVGDFEFPEKLAASISMFTCVAAIGVCFWNFTMQNEFLKRATRLKVALALNSDEKSSEASSELFAFTARHRQLKPFRRAIQVASVAAFLPLLTYLVAVF